MESVCRTCRLLADCLGSYEQSLKNDTPYTQPVDFLLGSHDDIRMRSADGCASCRSILGTINPSSNDVLTAHFSANQPRVSIISDSLDSENIADPDSWLRSRKEKNLSSATFLTADAVNQQEPHARIVNDDHVDVELIKSWIHRCDTSHEKTCHRSFDKYLLPKATLNFIDVHDLCIVTPAEKEPRYVALSYVWGTANVLLALKQNIEELRRPGAFGRKSHHVLPRTLRDAIELTAELGVRYLWVDSVCIVQDDAESQKEQLCAMGTVYAEAYFTIVALSSAGADSGIHRVGVSEVAEGGRTALQEIIQLPSKPLVRTRDGKAKTINQLNSSDIKWNTRGWTLQEKVFSRRLLALGDMATWSCFGNEWYEDLHSPTENIDYSLPADHANGNKMGIVTWPSIRAYSELAAEYSKRDLTYSVDAINAFLGVMTPMAGWFPGGLLHGISEFTFDIGMLWNVGHSGAHLRRDPGAPSPLKTDVIQHPTWSWAAWTGELKFDIWKAGEDYKFPRGPVIISPLAKWQKQLVSGGWIAIDNTYHVVRKHFENNTSTSLPDGWTNHRDDEGRVYCQHENLTRIIPTPKFSYPIPPFVRYRDIDQRPFHPHIRFQGSLAHAGIHIDPDERDILQAKLLKADVALETDILSLDGFWCGRVTIPLERGDVLPQDGQVCEIIAISEGTVDMSAIPVGWHIYDQALKRPELEDILEYEVINVLYIGRCANGMVYRKGLGGVWKPAWDDLTPVESELILT